MYSKYFWYFLLVVMPYHFKFQISFNFIHKLKLNKNYFFPLYIVEDEPFETSKMMSKNISLNFYNTLIEKPSNINFILRKSEIAFSWKKYFSYLCFMWL